MKIINTVKLPRISGGVDWGRTRVLLVRKGNKLFFQVPGHTGWNGVGSRGYYATSYYIIPTNLRDWQRVGEGRLTKSMLKKLRCTLESFFGETGFVKHISIRNTVILD